MRYGEPTSQRELTEAKAHGKTVLNMKRAENRNAFNEALEQAATAVDAEWRKENGLNCTHVCAVIRSLKR